MIHVDLNTRVTPDLHTHRFVCLRELCGHDELWDDTAIGLIDRLLVDRPGVAFGPGDAKKLTLSETDRVLAAIYRSLYGDAVECHVACSTCGSTYAMSFTLTELWDSVRTPSPDDDVLLADLVDADGDGVYRFRSLRFRLPTGDDVQVVAGLAPDDLARALRRRCVVDDDRSLDEDALDRVLSLAGPILDMDLDSTCSECGTAQGVPFRLDEFLLSALRRESPLLTREVHELARAYRWSRHEILQMTRRERRQHAELVLAELGSGDTWP
jgi:hypothetical protein